MGTMQFGWTADERSSFTVLDAFVAAGGDSGRRLARAFQPDFASAAAGPAELTLWLTPPAYTGVAPLFVAAGAGTGAALQPGELVVPSASAVLDRVDGGGGAPEIRVDDAVIPFSTVDAANYELSATLDRGRRLAVVQDGGTLPLGLLFSCDAVSFPHVVEDA